MLVAARDLKDEEILKPDMVKVIRMAKSAVPPGAFPSFKDVEDRWVKIEHARRRRRSSRRSWAPRGRRRAWSPTSPRGCGPSPSRSTSRRASRGSSCPTTAWTWSATSPDQDEPAHGETILQDVLVLASGQVFTRPEERSLTIAHRDPGRDPRAGGHPGRGPGQGAALAVAPRGQRPRGRRPARAEAAAEPGGDAVEGRGGEAAEARAGAGRAEGRAGRQGRPPGRRPAAARRPRARRRGMCTIYRGGQTGRAGPHRRARGDRVRRPAARAIPGLEPSTPGSRAGRRQPARSRGADPHPRRRPPIEPAAARCRSGRSPTAG